MAVVGAGAAVFLYGAAKLAHHHQPGSRPLFLAQAVLECLDAQGQLAQQPGQRRGLGRVAVHAAQVDERQRPVGLLAQQPAHLPGQRRPAA